ncbi:MAG: hypothetical protein HY298_10270 [Verrucomicrobia bacterium]|nr:hypothetical protein [Verrucomicrobiota bacterium]
MKLRSRNRVALLNLFLATAALLLCAGDFAYAQSAVISLWGLTLTNINNPVKAVVKSNSVGSITITAGGGDTWETSDSFTFAFQQVTGDFDVRVRIISLSATDPMNQDSPKGALMARADLTPGSPNIQINALPSNSARNGQLEGIARLTQDGDTEDNPGTIADGACTYPNLWLRIQRQGDKFKTYYWNTNVSRTTPVGTNGWELATTILAGSVFPRTMYVGLSTVSHNNTASSGDRVSVTYADYGNTPTGTLSPTKNSRPGSDSK